MTTTPERTATVEDITHPHWCDLKRCDPNPGGLGGEHTSHGTMWPSRADAAQTTVSLVHSDDLYAGDGKDAGSTRVRLEIFHTEYVAYADVHFSPDEARLISAALTRYADDAQQDNRVGRIPCTAAELREGRAP